MAIRIPTQLAETPTPYLPLLALIVAVLAALTAMPSRAENDCDPWMAKLVSVQGQAEVARAGATSWQRVSLKTTLCAGDRLRVAANSRAAIILPDQSEPLRLDGSTVLTFAAPQPKQPFWVELLRGALYFISRKPRVLEIRTPFVNAAVKGTEFVVRVDPSQTTIWVLQGEVLASNALGQLMLTPGQAGVAEAGKAPVRRILVKPRDAVQWTLYYPPIIDYREEIPATGPAAQAILDARTLADRNDLPAAIEVLDRVPDGARDADLLTFRASLLLSVGQVDQALSDLRRALSLRPENATVFALQSVVAVVQNDRERALRLAQRAIRADSASPVAQVALSYAYQAGFEIENARGSARKAVDLAPRNALAWARLAELELSLGERQRALTAARRATTLAPHLERTQTVLGFVYLARTEIDRAQAAFEKAIESDSAAPLPRLGLGLATIRQGDLAAGTRQIEIAASLDPDNSLVRSYLGKAYFEEKRGPQAQREYATAEQLDPKDPTPWFYEAIYLQTVNQPAQALEDLQKAIELNDNRAVYRSRLLLDEDQAARGASLARIYDDLGFEQLALTQSTQSLSLDPANYSAHRFLSDTYVQLPRHEIAQVSELLQAQLLQPININPVQPHLLFKGVNIASGVGPGRVAFNEFTPLFERNRAQLNASAIAGNNQSYGDEVVLSGLRDRFSYSLGQFHYQTDGFREGSDIEHNIYDAFAQAALTDRLNIQLEYRHRSTEQGDVRLDLDPAFIPTQRRSLDQDVARTGVHLSLSPGSDLIASLIYSERGEKLSNDADVARTDISDDRQGYQVEGEYLFRSERFNVTLGTGIYRVGANTLTTTIVSPPPLPFLPAPPPGLGASPSTRTTADRADFDIDGNNVFAYAQGEYPSTVHWTVGLSYETYKQTQPRFKLNKINPKLGIRWDISDTLAFRATYLRALKRLLAVDQTIEPTQVAGFNQFFDDFNGSQTELYGIAMDAILADGLYGGVEVSRRNVTQPNQVSGEDGAAIAFSDRSEDVYHGYLYWTPHPRWSLSSEYRFERDELSFDLKTQSLPVAVRYFDPRGYFGQIGPTFVWQDKALPDGERFSEHFAVVDAALGYRLPKRRGVVSLEVNNLLDKDFRFQDSSFKTSDQFNVIHQFLPGRTILARFVLSF